MRIGARLDGWGDGWVPEMINPWLLDAEVNDFCKRVTHRLTD
jgi:hypothetical protein